MRLANSVSLASDSTALRYRASCGELGAIKSVDRVRVHKRGAPGVKRWIEPEPAFGRKFRRHLDVGNQKLILENLASEFRTHHLPQRGSRTVAGDDIIGAHPIGPVRRLDGQH